MFCAHCGTKAADEARFCMSCGKALRGASIRLLKPLLMYPANGAFLLGFVGWLAQRSREEIIGAAFVGAVVGLVAAGIELAVSAARRR